MRGDCSSRVDASALLSYPDEAAISPRWTKASEELLPSLFSLKPSRKLFNFSLCFFQLARRSTRLCNRKNTLVPCSISFREAVVSLHKELAVAPLRVIKRSFSQCFFFFSPLSVFRGWKRADGKNSSASPHGDNTILRVFLDRFQASRQSERPLKLYRGPLHLCLMVSSHFLP